MVYLVRLVLYNLAHRLRPPHGKQLLRHLPLHFMSLTFSNDKASLHVSPNEIPKQIGLGIDVGMLQYVVESTWVDTEDTMVHAEWTTDYECCTVGFDPVMNFGTL